MTTAIRVDCFWCEPLLVADLVLRRWSKWDPVHPCPGNTLPCLGHYGYASIGEIPWPIEEPNNLIDRKIPLRHAVLISAEDRRYPTKCDRCDYAFLPTDRRDIQGARKYRHAGTGEIFGFSSPLPVGAMSYDVASNNDRPSSTDGRSLFVVVPGPRRSTSRWPLDGRMRGYDKGGRDHEKQGRTHWDRSGTIPKITVSPGLDGYWFSGDLIDGVLTGNLEVKE